MPPETPLALQLEIGLTGADAEELDALTRQLCGELADLDGVSAAPVPGGAAPAGAKGVDPMLVGLVAVSVGPTLLTKFLDFLHAWAMRREGQAVKIKLQTPDGAALEVEVPASMPRAEVQQRVSELSAALKEAAARKGKK